MSLRIGFLILFFALGVRAETNFLDLYKCDDNWETINGRNGFRVLDCNAKEVRNGESCDGTNFICLGMVHCKPIEPIDGANFPEGLDPDFLGVDFEYMAGCKAKNANECKKPVECMQESMEKHVLKGDVNVTRQERILNNSRGRR
jgi:hypothetical protein